MPMNRPLKTVAVHKVRILVCGFCGGAPAEYLISYSDPDGANLKPLPSGRGYFPIDSIRACEIHVAEVTAILLRRNGLLRDDTSDATAASSQDCTDEGKKYQRGAR